MLIGTTKREKVWIGGIGGVISIVFILVSQIIKLQTGFFESRSLEASEAVGNWVVIGYFVLGLYLLVIINYRIIKTALKMKSRSRWLLIITDVIVTVAYLIIGGFGLFIVAFTYFPFAP